MITYEQASARAELFAQQTKRRVAIVYETVDQTYFCMVMDQPLRLHHCEILVGEVSRNYRQ